ncbi:leucine-rich repeat-containing protein 37A2-like [Apus apus]|uniref:leucine-rich repeat-containing protein 37A2-like n=1 Tax=Apus apus TaxID=8895 RepID=UPI0021F91587|nr:leucine-rich repeat-containing protein 37A2-like [Apus apus]
MQFLQKLILSHNPLSVIADTSFFKLPSVNYLLILLEAQTTPAPAEQGKDQAVLVCSQLQSNQGAGIKSWDTKTSRSKWIHPLGHEVSPSKDWIFTPGRAGGGILSWEILSVCIHLSQTCRISSWFSPHGDLGATGVTQQTLLTVLLTTTSLETLKLPSASGCCFCQGKHTIETPCRTIQFHCENLCLTSAPQYADTDPLAERKGGIQGALQARKLSSSVVLSLKSKEPSLGDHKTITFVVELSLTSTAGDLSDLNDGVSRTNSRSPQHPSRQEGKTGNRLRAELKKKLHQARSVRNTLPVLAVQKDKVQENPAVKGEAATGWVQKQLGSGWNPTEDLSVFRHHRRSTAPSKRSPPHSPAEAPHSSRSWKSLNYSDAVDQTEKTQGLEDAEEPPAPRQDHVGTYKRQKQGDNPSLYRSNQHFYQTFGSGNPEEEPPPMEGEAEQRLETNQHLFYDLSGKSSQSSSPAGHSPAIPPTTGTPWKPQKEGSSSLNKAGSSGSPEDSLVAGDLWEAQVDGHLRGLVPDESLRTFLAGTARALRMDCGLPQLQLPCTQLLSKTGQLIKLLSQREDDQGASDPLDQCLLEGNVSKLMVQARDAGGKKPEHTSRNRVLLAILLCSNILITLTALCLMEVCSQKPAAASQPYSTRGAPLRWFSRFFQKLLPWGWRRHKPQAREQVCAGSDQNQTTPEWLRHLEQPLSSQQEKALAELYDGERSEEEEEEEEVLRLSLGAISLGAISLGAISLGAISLGAISLGAISLGAISLGAISLGALSLGAISLWM